MFGKLTVRPIKNGLKGAAMLVRSLPMKSRKSRSAAAAHTVLDSSASAATPSLL